MTEEAIGRPGFLEQYRCPSKPNIYILDENVAPKIVKRITEDHCLGIFGIEVGFGEEIAFYPNIVSGIVWLATESYKGCYDRVVEDIGKEFPKRDLHLLNSLAIIIANVAATREMMSNASVILFKNPRSDINIGIPKKTELKPGQRLIILITTNHLGEIPQYRQMLEKLGYNGSDLKSAKFDKPIGLECLNDQDSDAMRGYVFDFMAE